MAGVSFIFVYFCPEWCLAIGWTQMFAGHVYRKKLQSIPARNARISQRQIWAQALELPYSTIRVLTIVQEYGAQQDWAKQEGGRDPGPRKRQFQISVTRHIPFPSPISLDGRYRLFINPQFQAISCPCRNQRCSGKMPDILVVTATIYWALQGAYYYPHFIDGELICLAQGDRLQF